MKINIEDTERNVHFVIDGDIWTIVKRMDTILYEKYMSNNLCMFKMLCRNNKYLVKLFMRW